MKICVLSGSPKGGYSGTLQWARFMEQNIPGHEFKYLDAAAEINKIEKDEEYFQSIMAEIKSCDGVIWAFPLYVLLVHANLKRFIELIWERKSEAVFKGKYTAVIASSIHFFDNTAINYLQAICDDLDMQFTGYFSADMENFMEEKRRAEFLVFAGDFIDSMAYNMPMRKKYPPLPKEKIEYTPLPATPLDMLGQKTVVLTDDASPDTNIGKMVERFATLTGADVIDISKIKMLSSCLGCIHCGFDNECVFHGKDDIENIYNALEEYDIIVYAGEMRDRYFSARWKMFHDRRFFKTHQPHYTEKQVGYLVSGPLSQNENLYEILDAMAQMCLSNFCGALTDEYAASEQIDARMDAFAKRMANFAEQKYVQPKTFLGVGAFKLFRDDMWGRLRFPFRMDYLYYKKHGLFDFPQKNIKSRLQNSFMLFLIKFPKMKKEIQKRMKEYMIQPHKKILQEE